MSGWTFIGWTAGTPYNNSKELDDENASSDNPTQEIYKTNGEFSYTLAADVTMYPVFTKYDDNEDVDLVNGGEFFMYFYRDENYYKDDYFGADNHHKRIYASNSGLSNGAFGYTTLCSNAQLFEFIQKGDGWNIRLKNADGTYPTYEEVKAVYDKYYAQEKFLFL